MARKYEKLGADIIAKVTETIRTKNYSGAYKYFTLDGLEMYNKLVTYGTGRIVGIPNVGKSTFINSFAGKACAKTGNKPGVTRGKQWIRLNKQIELLDTPGILWPKFEDQETGLKLAFIGTIRDEIINTQELSVQLINVLEDLYPGVLSAFYDIETDGVSSADILDRIAFARGCISKGGLPDQLRAANLILENFRNAKIGRFTLESPGRKD